MQLRVMSSCVSLAFASTITPDNRSTSTLLITRRDRTYHHPSRSIHLNHKSPDVFLLRQSSSLSDEETHDDGDDSTQVTTEQEEDNNEKDDTLLSDNDRSRQSRRKQRPPIVEDSPIGKLEALKQRETELSNLLAEVQREKREAIRNRPLCIGIVGFGRFGQFIAQTFAKYGRVVVTSRSDYTDIAARMGVTYVPLDQPHAFLREQLDVVVFAVSILSFKSTIQAFLPPLQSYLEEAALSSSHHSDHHYADVVTAPLIVDVLSVKEHARSVLLELLPEECDILCTHPMFGPDSGKHSWRNLNFVYERTRVNNRILVMDHPPSPRHHHHHDDDVSYYRNSSSTTSTDVRGGVIHSPSDRVVNKQDTDSDAHSVGMDRMERFLSIWEEEGCNMVPLSCREHDAYAANSQFVTHLVGRVLGTQGLSETPIDTSGFQSVLKLVDSTTADSFDLFYGLFKYNQNSLETIRQLQSAMNDVVDRLKDKEREENIHQLEEAATKDEAETSKEFTNS